MLVTMTALMVAFGSSAKRHSGEEETLLLRQQALELRRENFELQEKLRWAESRYAQSRTLGKRLNEALLVEQAKNRALTERLQQTPPKDAGSSG